MAFDAGTFLAGLYGPISGETPVLSMSAPEPMLSAQSGNRPQELAGEFGHFGRNADDGDAERAAIQWTECGPAAELDVALRHAVREWNELTGLPKLQNLDELGSPSTNVPFSLDSIFDVPHRCAVSAPTKVKQTRRLIGNGFPPIPPTLPPAAIWASPAVTCPRCGLRSVLSELREMTGGKCWDCWAAKPGKGLDFLGPRLA